MFIVTGGAGFIGSVIVRQLNDLGIYDILIVDELGTSLKWKNLQNKRIAYSIHKDEFFDWLKENKKEIHGIYHMGACSSTTETDVDFLMENNFQYSKKIFEYCTQKAIPLIYASSAATYGSKEDNFIDSNDEINSPLLPINPYGYSKQVFDHWAISQNHTPPFWAGLKFFNVYGPNEYHKGSQASVIFHAYNQIQKNGSVKLFKSHRQGYQDGMQQRDFVYVKDVANVCLHLYKNRSHLESGVFNVGTGIARSFKDLATAVFKALNLPVNIEYVDMPENIRNQYQYFTEASMAKLINIGKYTASFYSLEEGAKDYVNHYLCQKDPFY